uniref:Uncharacterized protein n=1 Tax=Romanomermis culicivorax TaxID=13658 RepID=A0A915K163_ROMCU
MKSFLIVFLVISLALVYSERVQHQTSVRQPNERRLSKIEETAHENHRKMIKEFKTKFGGLKDNCFPRPNGGCRCVEKGPDNQEKTVMYDRKDIDTKCRLSSRTA